MISKTPRQVLLYDITLYQKKCRKVGEKSHAKIKSIDCTHRKAVSVDYRKINGAGKFS